MPNGKLAVIRSVPTDSRYEIVFEDTSSRSGSPPRLLEPLLALGRSSGSALGNAYALLAGTVLEGIERLEDLNAERRLRARSRGAAAKAPLARRGSPPTKALLPAK